MDFLKVTGISKKENDYTVINGIDLTVPLHHQVAIAGETGSGKSTLLKIISGFAQADQGEVRFEGVRVKGLWEKLIPGHPGIAYLSQQYELPNNMWVHEVLEYADDLPPGEASLLYRTCRIDHLLKRRTNQLSGGEKQRIALARLLTKSPKLLLLDEPFSNLDPIHKNILKNVIKDIGEKLGTTCMLASHDPMDTLSWADEIVVIQAGRIVQKGSPLEVYRQPSDAYVAGLFGSFNLIPAAKGTQLRQLSGVQEEKTIFFRPEDVRIVSAGADTIDATVEAIAFMGAYDELTLRADTFTFTARAMHHGVKAGDVIAVSFDTDQFWYW
ncbi:ABC transporter ATP-binding protein [Terrimonas sp. NA20]|uniref:ABC transporter ATP-binding protein n=1 Tax=Terrimonas ginsenosidimutans TaxID=2908004 RepID=A0ABS9KYJ6_9BACT|nr:ABC transporter ATP-binding protein [Terrimonas ginsenosidimutans]MCG2617410.1 ABC transporter ATP-binding protein [Terrimonas ginsenosidimutans]